MSDASNAERTHEATDQRREQFRKEGRHAQAKDLGGLAATVAVCGAIVGTREKLGRALDILFSHTLGDLGSLERLGTIQAFRSAAEPIAAAVLPLLAAAAFIAFAASSAQTRFRPNFDAFGIKLERLDPKAGFGRLFAFKKNAVQLLISAARAGAVGTVSWIALRRELPTLLAMSRAPTTAAAMEAFGVVGRVVVAALVSLVVIAAVDYAYSWFSLEREMRMTRQERVDESRREDGDPKLKARMKHRARALAKRRGLTGVKTADVIVTNPTHFAVALRYGPRDAAPTVVAKGQDDHALRIRSEARKYGIPILENRPLARALYAEVAVGRPIPQAHFAAVAHVLAFVYRLRARGAFRGTRRA